MSEVVSMTESEPEECCGIKSIQQEAEQPMDSEAASKVLGLLVRWALRRAQKQTDAPHESKKKVVTINASKGYTRRKANN